MKKTLFAAALAAGLIPSFVRAEEVAFRYLPEPAFDAIVKDAVGEFTPSDAFAGLPSFSVLSEEFTKWTLWLAVCAGSTDEKDCGAATGEEWLSMTEPVTFEFPFFQSPCFQT